MNISGKINCYLFNPKVFKLLNDKLSYNKILMVKFSLGESLKFKFGGAKMVELSSLYGLDIYTIKGKYVGRVQDVVLNIKKGRVSNLKVKAMKMDKRTVGLKEVIKTSIRIVPETDEIKPLKEDGILDIAYERVQAVGDILLISSEAVEKTSTTV